MRFGILGETRAWRADGAGVPLGGPARRALLALLLVRPRAVVSADRLAEEIAPAGASAHALHSQVSRLRAALGAEAVVERAGAGYRIMVADEDVDACRFERLAAEGRDALRDGDAGRAVPLLRQALALWRGPALADLPESGMARAAAVRLEELRLAALEDRAEGELRLGSHRAVVPELRELVSRHPLRERAAGLLMRALSADGGQAEALAVFEETRRHLAEELGADPSAELAGLHRELLSAGPSPSPVAPPAQHTSFVGRAAELAEIGELLRVARLVTLTGPGGVGKTRLSAEVAAASAGGAALSAEVGAASVGGAAPSVETVPASAGSAGGAGGEVCFAELAALRDGAGLAQALLGALGLRQNGLQLADGPRAPLDRLITALSDRHLLLVLDNCEHVVDEAAALVSRLLATCPRLRVLATSREPLGIIGEHVRPVRPLDGDAAARLFTDRARAARQGFAADPALVRRICTALDGLPLAIELAAARLRTLDVHDLAGRLDDLLGVTARGARTAEQRHRTLRTVVGWSWDLLGEDEQRAARRFTVFAGGATAEAALRVCGTDGDTLESLVDKSLLERVPGVAPVSGSELVEGSKPAGGRFRMLETIRAYGAERLEAAGEREEARHAHVRHYLELAQAAHPHLTRAGQLAWLPVLAAEHGNLLAALRWAVRAGQAESALRLLGAASAYLWIRGVSASAAPEAIALLDAAGDAPPPPGLGEEYVTCVLLAAAVPAGRAAWQRHRGAAGEALAAAWQGRRTGRYPAALLLWMMHNAGEPDPDDAYDLVSGLGDSPDPWVRAVARYVSGFGVLGAGDTGAAERAFREAADGFRAVGDRWGRALALDFLAGLAGGRGDREQAILLTDQALALTDELGALEDSADLLVNRGDHLAAGDPEAARADYARAAALARRAGSPAGLAAALRGLGDLALLHGDLAEAERLYTDALERIDPHWVKSIGNRVRALAGLGRTAEARGDHATARTHYRRAAGFAAAMGPSVPDALRLLGLPQPVVEAVSGP
ncbi:Signal transduction response regulator / Disease resistance domain-containing protein [[Actinomadura] parvosata subsp. kistnae]|uniref:ATPase n=1 Tax=[Actinomadura] parvosata subsp. kistnae TaxID=1909395 RepID=A0A1V0AEW1_9ACTN|nr:BTAD domain-containing putative transcriptional regulator [Nonomuraea sp. ATCC 55076]AQZ68726.1 ATPase [Nonomuraea sp. ATCC 55076]SPL92781.1 Signal transduction response regulator / Disease resistance domain-containing protein [Actinomadura parvosata subsp. kistnae]